MISWIQNHLIRHGRWIFLTLLAIIIIAFVFTIGNTPGCTSKQSGYTKQMFYGYDLNSSHEMSELSQKVSLSAILRSGRPIQNEQQFQSQLTSRIALLHLAEEIGIPTPGQETIAEYIQSMAAFRGPDGKFSRDAYTSFIDSIESNPNIKQDLIVVVLEEDYRIELVRKVLYGPGYFLPAEANSQVRRSETELTLITAEINYEEFDPEITLDENELKTYYENNIQRYEISERIQASYVSFPFDKYKNQVETPSEADLRQHFNTNRANFVADYRASSKETGADNARPEEETIAVTYEDVRDAVEADFKTQQARRLAHKAAQEFSLTLYNNNIEQDSNAFYELLQKRNLKLTDIAPYTMEDAANSFLPENMLEAAYSLNNKRYFSSAYPMEDRYGVLIYIGRIPSRIPAYEEVAGSVKSHYLAENKKRLFNEEGNRLSAELKEKIQTENFIPAAEDLGLKITKQAKFKVGEAPSNVRRTILQQAQNMRPGELSPMLTIEDNGIFIYLEEKTVPEITEDNEKLIQAKNFLRQYSSFTSYNSIMNELVAKGLKENNDK